MKFCVSYCFRCCNLCRNVSGWTTPYHVSSWDLSASAIIYFFFLHPEGISMPTSFHFVAHPWKHNTMKKKSPFEVGYIEVAEESVKIANEINSCTMGRLQCPFRSIKWSYWNRFASVGERRVSTKSQFLNNCKTRTEHDREFIFTSQFNGRSEAEIDTRTEHLLYVHRKKGGCELMTQLNAGTWSLIMRSNLIMSVGLKITRLNDIQRNYRRFSL